MILFSPLLVYWSTDGTPSKVLLVVGAQGLTTVVSNSVSESEEYSEENKDCFFFDSHRHHVMLITIINWIRNAWYISCNDTDMCRKTEAKDWCATFIWSYWICQNNNTQQEQCKQISSFLAYPLGWYHHRCYVSPWHRREPVLILVKHLLFVFEQKWPLTDEKDLDFQSIYSNERQFIAFEKIHLTVSLRFKRIGWNGPVGMDIDRLVPFGIVESPLSRWKDVLIKPTKISNEK